MNNKEEYINLLRSTNRKGVEELITYLETTDFYNAPASTRYHNSKPGGLLEHSLNVYRALKELNGYCGLYDNETLVIVALLHDICKIGFYTMSMRNVKRVGQWYSEPYYIVEDTSPLGHGEKSVIMALQMIPLKTEEIYAIRWHMGGFEPKENYNYVSGAFSKFGLALMLHMADLKATYYMEGKND